MDKTQLSVIYDKHFDRAAKLLGEADLCQFDAKGHCAADRKFASFGNPRPDGCCGGCNQLTPTGCSTRNLACKLYLCSFLVDNEPKADDIILKLVQIRRDFELEVGLGGSSDEPYEEFRGYLYVPSTWESLYFRPSESLQKIILHSINRTIKENDVQKSAR